MTTDSMLDRRLHELMAELAAPGDQSAAIDHVLSVTRELRPEPRWRVLLKERPMRTESVLVAGRPPLRLGFVFAVIALIALLAASIAVGAYLLRQPAVPPAYGPAGNGVIAYAEAGDIFTTDAAGANRTAITTGPAVDSRPVFSRDGTRVAFLRKENMTTRLIVANADGTGIHAISPEVNDDVSGFDWSPDGERLVLLADLLRAPGPRMAILVLAADGSGSAEPIDVDDPDIAPNGWIAWSPPTGDEILFRAHPTLLSPAAGLYAVDPAGGAPRTLLEPASGASNDDCAVCSIALSPDGRWATFWTWGPNDAGEVGGWGHVVNLSTGAERIATTWGGNTSPVTPDGDRVIGVGARLEIEPIDGSAPSRSIGPVLETAGLDLALSPDGTQVLAIEASGKRTLIDIETGEATELDLPSDTTFSWQRIALP